MELLQLRYFFESAKHESLAKTAEKYMVPTTSVSASIRRLERELGCQLFDRLPNRILLNENGRRLQQSLYVVFGELDDAVGHLSAPVSDAREIRMLVRAMRNRIMDSIIAYMKRHPHVSIQTVFDFDITNTEGFDVIIDDDPRAYTEYESFELCSTHLRLKASTRHPLCGRTLTLSQLRHQPFLSMGEQSSMHRTLLSACKRAGFTPNIVVQTNDSQCYKTCLEAGIGIGIGRDSTAEAQAGVAFLNVTDFDARQTVYAFYQKQQAYGNLAHFLAFLHSQSFV